MTREDREHEIADQIGYLDRLVEHLRDLCPPGIPVSVLGFSQGVATACRWAMQGRTSFDRIVLWGGTLPPELEAANMRGRWKESTVLLVHGEKDTVVNEAAHSRNEARLRESGVRFHTVAFEGGHALDGLTLKRVLAPDR
jgi:predicted esterase